MHYCDRDFENRLKIQNNQIEATFKTSFLCSGKQINLMRLNSHY
ncbi:hypothetical protein GCM10007203_11100 [Staphylococcus nepalensis]|nr:hypothetical protein GCM10007203_11100 [Staphylococcus nepalensis]